MEEQKRLIGLRSKFNKQSYIEDTYQQKIQVQDRRFGPVTFWSKKRGHDLLLMKKRFVNSAEACQNEINQAKDRLKLNHDFLMRMFDYSVKVKSLRVFEVWGFYQAPLQDLRREIDKRQKTGR